MKEENYYVKIKNVIESYEVNRTVRAFQDMLKDPIFIPVNQKINHLTEKVLHQYLLNMLENKFLELGSGFALMGHEYKINL